MSEQATYTEHVYQEYSCGSFVDPLHQREEIVRCKDCLNYVEGLITDDNEREPSYCFHWKREYIREDGFCAWGERMK